MDVDLQGKDDGRYKSPLPAGLFDRLPRLEWRERQLGAFRLHKLPPAMVKAIRWA